MDLHIVQDTAESGRALMAEDANLLQRAERGEIGPTLRFYQWEIPTVSLGYHQSADVLDAVAMARDRIPWVRRPTGGAAVLHSDELTYALIVPGCEGRGVATAVQEYVSRSIADGLCALGVRAEAESRGEPITDLPNRVSCFVRTSRWEVTARGRKLVGSAQRLGSGALLQHGSILAGEDHLRIVEYLRIADQNARQTLRERLRAKSTSIATELTRRIDMADLRRVLAECFAVRFPRLVAQLWATDQVES